jgi:hypothetical protein
MAEEIVRTSDSSGTNFLLGVILLIVALFLFFYYGLPMIQGAAQQPSIQVPGKVDVNVNSK